MAPSAEATCPTAQTKGIMSKLRNLLAGKATGEATGRGKDKKARKEARKGTNTSTKDGSSLCSTFLALFSCFGLFSEPRMDDELKVFSDVPLFEPGLGPCGSQAQDKSKDRAVSDIGSVGSSTQPSSAGGASSSCCGVKPRLPPFKPLDLLTQDAINSVVQQRNTALLSIAERRVQHHQLERCLDSYGAYTAQELEVQREAIQAEGVAESEAVQEHYMHIISMLGQQVRAAKAELEEAEGKLAAARC